MTKRILFFSALALLALYCIGQNRCNSIYSKLEKMTTEATPQRIALEGKYFALQCNQ